MWGVFRFAYDDVARERFESDLASKTDVILLHDGGDDRIVGFSTLVTSAHVVQGRQVVAVFSGDTIIEPAYWGQTALQRAFLSYVVRCKLRHPLTPVYWFLITKGYKTYLLLARNFPEHWPRYDQATPAWQAAVIDEFARSRYADEYQPALGILRHKDAVGKLKSDVAPIEGALLDYPDIRFFVERNPGHADGDELCSIGRVNSRLWASYMTKLARRALSHATGGLLPLGQRRSNPS